MRVPTIHLNGTSGEELDREAGKAWQALQDAITALAAMSPNGRDYYPQGAGAFEEAVREHQARIAAVRGVQTEIGDYLKAVWQAQAARG